MKKDITKDEAILAQVCEPVTEEDAQLVEDLMDTIESIDGIACLAANQIGVTKAAGAYVDDNDEVHIIYNPKLRKALYPIRTVEECFSVDGESKVTRYGRISISYDVFEDGKLVNKKGDFEGNEAQVILHLIDHNKGKLV